jgi:hypothetical protein
VVVWWWTGGEREGGRRRGPPGGGRRGGGAGGGARVETRGTRLARLGPFSFSSSTPCCLAAFPRPETSPQRGQEREGEERERERSAEGLGFRAPPRLTHRIRADRGRARRVAGVPAVPGKPRSPVLSSSSSTTSLRRAAWYAGSPGPLVDLRGDRARRVGVWFRGISGRCSWWPGWLLVEADLGGGAARCDGLPGGDGGSVPFGGNWGPASLNSGIGMIGSVVRCGLFVSFLCLL